MTLPLELGGVHDPSVRRALEIISQQFPVAPTGGGGGAPTGPAGGDLGNSYPNPTVIKAQSGFTIGGVAAVLTSDSRLSDARTPTAHATSHQPGGTDAMAVDAAAATGSLRTLGTGAAQAAAGNDARLSDTRTPTALSVVDASVSATAAIAESKLNLATDAAAGTGSRRTLGTTATSAAAGNRGLPVGGTSGQALTKNSATDYDVGWTTITGTSAAQLAGAYDPIVWGGGILPAGAVAATYILWCGHVAAGTSTVGSLAGAQTAAAAFYLDPADWTVSGLTTKLRCRFACHATSTAPGQTITCGLYPVATYSTTTIATLGTVVTGSTVVFTTPPANNHTQSVSTDINVPTAGFYILGAVIAGTTTAGSSTILGGNLQRRWV